MHCPWPWVSQSGIQMQKKINEKDQMVSGKGKSRKATEVQPTLCEVNVAWLKLFVVVVSWCIQCSKSNWMVACLRQWAHHALFACVAWWITFCRQSYWTWQCCDGSNQSTSPKAHVLANSNSCFPRLLWENGIMGLSDITADHMRWVGCSLWLPCPSQDVANQCLIMLWVKPNTHKSHFKNFLHIGGVHTKVNFGKLAK